MRSVENAAGERLSLQLEFKLTAHNLLESLETIEAAIAPTVTLWTATLWAVARAGVTQAGTTVAVTLAVLEKTCMNVPKEKD